jgi:dolichol kinase
VNYSDAAAFASIAERFEQMDDNISIPVGSAIITVLPALLWWRKA